MGPALLSRHWSDDPLSPAAGERVSNVATEAYIAAPVGSPSVVIPADAISGLDGAGAIR